MSYDDAASLVLVIKGDIVFGYNMAEPGQASASTPPSDASGTPTGPAGPAPPCAQEDRLALTYMLQVCTCQGGGGDAVHIGRVTHAGRPLARGERGEGAGGGGEGVPRALTEPL